MRKFYAAISVLLLTLLCLESNAQKKDSLQLQTDVFILNTCEPDRVSMMRIGDGNRHVKKQRPGVLSVNTKRFTAFKITNINPLRYDYFINNELVTNFMETSPFTLNSASLAYGGLPVSEIDALQIFKTTFESTNQKEILKAIRAEIETVKDSIELIRNEIDNMYYELLKEQEEAADEETDEETEADTASRAVTAIPRLQDETEFREQTKPLNDRLRVHRSKLRRKLKEYETAFNNLAINTSGGSGLMKKYEEYDAFKDDSLLLPIIKNIRKYGVAYRKMDSIFTYVMKNLNAIDRRVTDTILQAYGFIPPRIEYFYSSGYDNYDYDIQLKEFIINKKFHSYEEFVLMISTDIGKLLQNQSRDFSRRYNDLSKMNCLDAADIDSIKTEKKKLERAFEFIQDISTDWYIIVNYLGIDYKNYKDIVTNINLHYKGLLNYLKYFDHLNDNNTLEYTLPTHNNLKNIDLIRYKIERQDKITKGAKQSYVYDIWLKGGLKVDFSVGFFASYLLDNQYDKMQYYRDSSGVHLDSAVQITRKEIGRANFGFGGMVNISPRVGASWVNGSLSFGVIYANNQNLQFLSGLSLHLGKTERIILHGGIALGQVKVLDKSQNLLTEIKKDEIYRYKGELANFTISLVDRFEVKPFFGLSYNLSKRNALQAVSGEGLTKYNSTLPSNGQ